MLDQGAGLKRQRVACGREQAHESCLGRSESWWRCFSGVSLGCVLQEIGMDENTARRGKRERETREYRRAKAVDKSGEQNGDSN